jgi:hypothetical protein
MASIIQQLRHHHGISRTQIEDKLSQGEPRPWTPELANKVRKNFQKEVTALLGQATKYDGENRVRQKPQEVWAFGQEASLSCSVPPAHARADGPAQGLGSHPRLLVEPLGDFPPDTAQSLALFAGLL